MRAQEESHSGPSPLGPPSLDLQALEAGWAAEALLTAMYPPPLALLPPARKSPVLVLPGFTAGDSATAYLRTLLRWQGFWASPARLGLNLGPTKYTVKGLRDRLDRLANQHQRPIALVGISLGGVFARELARELPHLVSQVITLGSPYRKLSIDKSTVEPLWDKLRPLHDGDLHFFDQTEESRSPLRVPAASIYTRTDGVVSWQLCVDTTGAESANPRAENIEVYGTHTGMAHNASVLFAVADRLIRLENGWRPFNPPIALRGWYPAAVRTPLPRR